eukprot:8019991-Pyramimonas_sp.AAC.1
MPRFLSLATDLTPGDLHSLAATSCRAAGRLLSTLGCEAAIFTSTASRSVWSLKAASATSLVILIIPPTR